MSDIQHVMSMILKQAAHLVNVRGAFFGTKDPEIDLVLQVSVHKAGLSVDIQWCALEEGQQAELLQMGNADH